MTEKNNRGSCGYFQHKQEKFKEIDNMSNIMELKENIKQMKKHAEVIRKMGEAFIEADIGNNRPIGKALKTISEYLILNHLAISQLEETINFLQQK